MQSQPRSGSTALSFDRDEWELLVTLPRRVLLAAVAATPADTRGPAEGIAGIEAIASGLASSSPLVREVVGSIYAEAHASGDDDDQGSVDGALVQTLAACRYAGEVLSRATAEDARAYREWILRVAAVASGPAGPDSRFLYALGGLLR